MKFFKYHALGNDYIVIDPKDLSTSLTPGQIKTLCHRNYGVGSDGILLGPLSSMKAEFGLQIFNPDGSEAEKSGNGLRIFSRYLWDRKLVANEEFSIDTRGGIVKCKVLEKGEVVRVEMGKASFWSDKIPLTGLRREVINEQIEVGERNFTFCALSMGNPHCVLTLSEISSNLANQFGPLLETHSFFPNRTNVQFMKVIDRSNIQIEIWERGAGYTLASGSSSCAAAVVAYKNNLCERAISVHMPGGKIEINIRDDFDLLMTGPVTKVSEGNFFKEIFQRQ